MLLKFTDLNAAEFLIRISAISEWPFQHAKWKPDLPSLIFAFRSILNSQEFVISTSAILKRPLIHAQWNPVQPKDFRGFGVALVRRMTAATAAITLVHLFVEMLCYVLGRLHSSCVLSTRIGLHRIEVINKTLVIFQKKIWIFYLFIFKVISSENFSFQSYQNKYL